MLLVLSTFIIEAIEKCKFQILASFDASCFTLVWLKIPSTRWFLSVSNILGEPSQKVSKCPLLNFQIILETLWDWSSLLIHINYPFYSVQSQQVWKINFLTVSARRATLWLPYRPLSAKLSASNLVWESPQYYNWYITVSYLHTFYLYILIVPLTCTVRCTDRAKYTSSHMHALLLPLVPILIPYRYHWYLYRYHWYLYR